MRLKLNTSLKISQTLKVHKWYQGWNEVCIGLSSFWLWGFQTWHASDELMASYCKDVLKYFLKMIETQFSNNIIFFSQKKKKIGKLGFNNFFKIFTINI